MRTRSSRLLLALLLAVPVAAQQAPRQDFPGIKNFLRVNEQICAGGQPAMEDLARLKAEGVRAVINLRPPGEHNAEEEAAKAKELGLRYINIPVVSADPKDEQADQFLKVT